MPQLRDYQIKAVQDVFAAFANNEKVMLQMPTGTGKTTVFCEVIKQHINANGNRILVLVHRKELVHQIVERLATFGFCAGIIMAGHEPDYDLQVQVASVQSITRRGRAIIQNISLIIVDEAHHVKANTYLNIIRAYSRQNPYLLGVTATPIRLSGQGFTDVFDRLIKSQEVDEFVKQGFLAPIKHYAWHVPNTDGLKISSTKDFDEKELEKLMTKKQEIAAVVESYENYAENKKVLVFAVNIAHAQRIAFEFNLRGYLSKLIHSNTPVTARKEIVEGFKNGEVKILINVNIFTEGFDCPDVEAVILARPTKSLTLYLQQIGRAMRPSAGKDYGIVLDNAGLWKEHGLANEYREWTLNGTEIKRKKLKLNKDKEVIESEESETEAPQETKGAVFKPITPKPSPRTDITPAKRKRLDEKWDKIKNYFVELNNGLKKVSKYHYSTGDYSHSAALEVVLYAVVGGAPEEHYRVQITNPFEKTEICFEKTMNLFFRRIQTAAEFKTDPDVLELNMGKSTLYAVMQIGRDLLCYHPTFELDKKAAEKVSMASKNMGKNGFYEEKRFLVEQLYNREVIETWKEIWERYLSINT